MTIPIRFKPTAALTAIAGTQHKLALIATSGGVWECAPVSERPEIVLTNWLVFEVQLPSRNERSRHFAGQNMTDCEGRASSAIVIFDPQTGQGITESGRVYQLQGRTGFTGDGEYTWNQWSRINSVSGVVNVTAEIKKLMEKK